MTHAPTELNEYDLARATGGQTREHVLLSRQVGVPARAKDEDEDRPLLILNPDGP